MSKQLMFDDNGRQKILKGAQSLAGLMKLTLGPTGRNVLVGKSFGSPEVVKDGNLIAKEMELPDPFENMGAKMVAEAASKTSDIIGDGTATTAILAHAIYEIGLKSLSSGLNPTGIKKGIDRAAEAVVESLKKNATPVKTKEDYLNIAVIAANHNELIGKHIAAAMEKVGKEGIITVEESQGREITLEFAEGLSFDKGYISPYFVNNPGNMTCLLEDPFILLYDKKISSVQELVPLLEQVAQSGSALLIVADEVENEALTVLVLNKLQGVLKVAAVKTPAFGDRKKSIMEDIAVVTGGKFFSEEMGVKLENIQLSDLGRAKSAKIEKENTYIIQGAGKKSDIEARLSQIRKQIQIASSDYDREKLEERLAKLSGGAAIIKVGAVTESEQKDKKNLVENAVHSAQAAREEGFLPGGGVAYLAALPELDKLLKGADDTSEIAGINIIKEAIQIPFRQIVSNSGGDASLAFADTRAKTAGSGAIGYDAKQGKMVDMVKAGIVDPAKLLRVALQNAASAGGLMLTVKTFLTDLKDNEKKITESVV
jgi:chaperonin GroEL